MHWMLSYGKKRKMADDDFVKVVIRQKGIDADYVRNQYMAIVRDNLTEREFKIIKEDGGVRIVIMGLKEKGLLADYVGKDDDGRHLILVPRHSARNPETLLHETIHILQAIDPTRPEIDRHVFDGTCTEQERYDRLAFKEATTEAEMISRVKEINGESGYYSRLEKDDPIALKRKDHALLHDDRTVAAGRFAHTVEERFDRTEISRLKFGGREAIKTRDIIREKMRRRG